MQWFGWATALTVETLLVALGLRLLWGWPHHPPLVVAVSLLPVAAAIAMGSTRRLAARIDRILAHTVSLAGLTGIVVVVYLVVVLGLEPLAEHPVRARAARLLSMAAAAIATLFYGPARQRLSQMANRIVYGEREAPDAVLRTFGSRLSRAVPMDELLLQVAESLRKTLALTRGRGLDRLGRPARAGRLGARRPGATAHAQRRRAAGRGAGRRDRHRLARGVAARHARGAPGLGPPGCPDHPLGPGARDDRGGPAAGR